MTNAIVIVDVGRYAGGADAGRNRRTECPVHPFLLMHYVDVDESEILQFGVLAIFAITSRARIYIQQCIK
jgi:hypothetical protein